MRSPSHLISLLLVVLPATVLAQTDAQTASLARRLKQGAEPEHRIQAARLLGESDDPEALQPLCSGLEDASAEVRAAAAGGLEKLGELGGLECLEAHKDEPDAAARAAQESALRSLRALKAKPPRLYVMLAEVKDTTGTLPPELVKLTEARLRRKLVQSGAWLAPEKESEAAAKGVLRKQKIQGYRLVTEIRPGPSEGLKLSVMCLRYPGKQLLGNVEVQASGGEPGDLLAALAPRAIEEAAGSFGWK
ncbi:HEAT repeat domain-containing protein [Vitiosangium sp. GDMCC 1.1324]|uniref:HEAT repeat domain-containing protein n=1 Tax=Vitiosangium sp. (strain GDMCC 1.1324) TaxID=2138576 RepID=UPI000D39EACF|nr:HEAT repeat domain-containing protein [Vitiosangium sp. GDMCC 1.1324]PTL78565.1 HEAT repeat domain-containing protein [Vitiosangium sp. GDMCC 1.1324]